jgi:hemerythrin-like domain-containing protein
MVVVHRALRRELALLPGVVGAAAAGDWRRSTTIGRHARLVLTFLREHHDSEDRLLWPGLRSRIPLSDPLIDTLEEQHRVIADLLVHCQPEFTSWSRTGDPGRRDRIVERLAELERVLLRSFDLEERDVLPFVRGHPSTRAWAELHGQSISNGVSGFRAPLMVVGMVLEDATPREGAWFMSTLPSSRRLLWRAIGSRWYAGYSRHIRRDVARRAVVQDCAAGHGSYPATRGRLRGWFRR